MHRPRIRIALLTLSAVLLAALPGHATVMVSGPDPSAASVFFGLEIPAVGGAADERGFSGFEYLLSGVDPAVDPFFAQDLYLIQGNDTNPTQAIGANLGDIDPGSGLHELSGVTVGFSLEHNLVGGRNFTWSITDPSTSTTTSLCWGQNCDPGAISAETINGEAPFDEFNGLQVQVRAQEVVGSLTSVQITALNGISAIVGDPLYDETVDPNLPGTVQPFPPFAIDEGRRAQWLIADSLDFLLNEWELEGFVTLSRPDGALEDRTKVRLAIDLVRDPTLPFVVPEPSTALLMGLGLAALSGRRGAEAVR